MEEDNRGVLTFANYSTTNRAIERGFSPLKGSGVGIPSNIDLALKKCELRFIRFNDF